MNENNGKYLVILCSDKQDVVMLGDPIYLLYVTHVVYYIVGQRMCCIFLVQKVTDSYG